MKWNEVKKHLNRLSQKALAAGLCAALVTGSLSGCGAVNETAAREEASKQPGGAETERNPENEKELEALLDTVQENTNQSETESQKEETVYLFADSEGKVTSTVVAGWLKNPNGQKVLTDRTRLLDVVNVKGNETFSQEGEEYRWQAEGRDIYYQGITEEEAPVTEKITYYLNGEPIRARELAGKSGRVKIRFDYENREKLTAAVNGKEEEIAVPFAVVTGMILDERFRNISVENGRIVSDGKNNIVVGFALPGLKESLKLDEIEEDMEEKEAEIPEYVEVTADVENFELDMTLTVATSSSDLSFEDALDFADLDDKIDTLTDSSAQLADGTGELAEGINTLKDSLGEFAEGVASLQDGIAEYTDGVTQLGDGISEVKSGAESLDDGAGALTEGIDALSSGARELKNGIDSARDGAGQLAAGINGENGAANGAGQLAGGAAALKAGFDGNADQGQPGALAASRQIAEGVSVLGSTVKDTMKQVMGMKNSLLESETAVVKSVYESVGMGDAAARINSSNVGQYAAGIDQIKNSLEEEIAGSVAAMVKQAAEGAAQSAAQAASEKTKEAMLQEFEVKSQEIFAAAFEQGKEQGYEQGKKDAEEGKAGENKPSDSKGTEENGAEQDEDSSSEGSDADSSAGGSDTGSSAGGSDADSSAEDSDAGSSNADAGNTGSGNAGDGNTGSGDAGSADSGTIGKGDSSDTERGGNSDTDNGSGDADSSDAGNADSGTIRNEDSSTESSDAGSSTGDENSSDAGNDENAGDGGDAEAPSVVETAHRSSGYVRRSEGLVSLKNVGSQGYGLVRLAEGSEGENPAADSAEALQKGMDGLVRIGQAQGAVEAIEKILTQLEQSGASMSQEQVAALEAQVDTLVLGAFALADGISQLSAGADALADGASKLNDGMETLGSGANTLADGMKQLADGGSELTEGADQLKSGGSELKGGTEKLRSGAEELLNGARELTGHSAELKDGAGELADGTGQIADGVGELSDGAGELLDGMLQFDEEGIQKIADAYEGDVKSLADRVKAVSDAGSAYDNFCGKEEGTKSSVKFILKTEAIKAE